MYCPHNGIIVSETKFACIGLDINFDFLIGLPHEIRKAGIWQEGVEKNKELKKNNGREYLKSALVQLGPFIIFTPLFRVFSGLSQSKINSEKLSSKSFIIWRVAACQKFHPHGKT